MFRGNSRATIKEMIGRINPGHLLSLFERKICKKTIPAKKASAINVFMGNLMLFASFGLLVFANQNFGGVKIQFFVDSKSFYQSNIGFTFSIIADLDCLNQLI